VRLEPPRLEHHGGQFASVARAADKDDRLVAVQGLARLLLLEQDQRLDSEGKSYLNRLAAAVRQADEMVRALAELGRLLRDTKLTHEELKKHL